MKPSTPLPWKMMDQDFRIVVGADDKVTADVRALPGFDDAAYIVHAANSYPKLVAAITKWAEARNGTAVMALLKAGDEMTALLRELGES